MKQYDLRPATQEEVEGAVKQASKDEEGMAFAHEEKGFQLILGEKVFVIMKDSVFVAEPVSDEEAEKRAEELAEKAFKQKVFKVYKKEQ